MSREREKTNPEVRKHHTRRRLATKTSLEEKSDETMVAVTSQEPLDGIHEKAMRIASNDEFQTDSSAGRWPSPGRAANDKTKEADELVRARVGQITRKGDIVVASERKSKLWRDPSLKRAIQHWNMKYVDVAKSPGDQR